MFLKKIFLIWLQIKVKLRDMKNIAAKVFILFASFIIISNISKAQNWPVGARSAALGNTSVMLSDVWSIYHNQAGLSWINSVKASVFFENKYFLKELSLKSAAIAIPTNPGTFGVSYSYFGYPLYNESKYGLAYAKSFADIFAIGIQLDYLNTHLGENYGNTGTAVAEIGIQAKPIKNMVIGAHVFNPWYAAYSEYNQENIPTILRFGIAYSFSEKVFLAVEAHKETTKNAIGKVAVEYQIINNLFLRTGINAKPIENFFGIGYNFKGFVFDLAFSKHYILGYTSSVSLSYSFDSFFKKK